MHTRLGITGRLLAVTVTAGLALGVAGCGDEGHSGPGYASKDSTVKADHSTALTKDNLVPTSYQASTKAGSAHMTMTMTGRASMRAHGDVSYAGGNPTMQMTLALAKLGAGKSLQMRYVGKILYMQIPGLTPAGKYLAIDPSDPSSPLAKSFAGLSGQMDPVGAMKSLQGAIKSVDRVGKGSIGGTPVDHYRVVVDTAKVLKAQKQKVPAGIPATLTYDMWLDQQHLLRRMTFAISGTSFEMLMSKWGEPVKVQRPAAGDVVKAPTPTA